MTLELFAKYVWYGLCGVVVFLWAAAWVAFKRRDGGDE